MSSKEMWKDIKEYEGYYQISNHGNVRSLDRRVKYSDGRNYYYKGRMLTQTKDNHGYLWARLTKGSKSINFSTHRLVGEYFLEGHFEGAVINHRDGNPLKNYYSNLEWCTQGWNVQHGKGWHRSKEKEVKESLKYLYVNEKKTTLEIAKLLNISDRTVRKYLKQLGIKMEKALMDKKTHIKAFDKKTNEFIGEYESQHECARKLDIDVRNINAVLKNKRKSCKGYYFKYIGN